MTSGGEFGWQLEDCEAHIITGVTWDAAAAGGGLGSFFRASEVACCGGV